jgi:hypothetical protein
MHVGGGGRTATGGGATLEEATGYIRELVLSFYERDRSVSVFDVKGKRMFLKRIVPGWEA